MKDWHKTLIPAEANIHDAIQCIDQSALQIALVIDQNTQKLLGTVTDGDIRRGILKGIGLQEKVTLIMNPQPVTVNESLSDEQVLRLMRKRKYHQIPVLNAAGQPVRLAVLDDLIRPAERRNPVVLMAGGLGTRLRPLTNDYPKPLLKVGSKPVLQTIIETFREQGFRRFYLSVNYKAEMIQAYFGDGADLDVEISYLHETVRLGTAGALSLLPEKPQEAFFVMNADLLTKVDFRHLLDFHKQHQAEATMCVREYDFQVPYGVVQLEGQKILAIQEKPVQRFFVNAGIYVLEPETLNLIPPHSFFDMPSLFEELIARKRETIVFPVREYWIDIGRMDDLEKANAEFQGVFDAGQT